MPKKSRTPKKQVASAPKKSVKPPTQKTPQASRKPQNPLEKALQSQFAISPPDVLTGFGAGASASSQREIVFKVTDYFDTPAQTSSPFLSYSWEPQSFLTDVEQGEAPLVRILSVKWYALPRFSLESDKSSVMVLFGLPVRQGDKNACSCQKSTLLVPRADASWICVGSWNSSHVFKDSIVTPQTSVLDSEDNSLAVLPLGSFCVVEPDTMSPVATAIQLRVDVTVAQTLPLITRVKGATKTSASQQWDSIEAPVFAELPVVVEAKAIRNSD